MRCTYFKSGAGTSKIPVPTHKNKSFEFITQDFKNIKEIFEINSNEFILSKPLSNSEPFISPRRIDSVIEYKSKILDYIILDIDNISTNQDYKKVLKYFKSLPYEIILGKSRSWNGQDNFNIKGIIRTYIENNNSLIKEILGNFQQDISFCKIDTSCSGDVSIQAPRNRKEVIYHGGTEILLAELVQKDSIQHKVEEYSQPFINECLNNFYQKGFSSIPRKNSNGTINFKHPTEKISKGGYFWSDKIPYMMFHNNQIKSLNIFKEVIKSDAGKKYLTEKFQLKNLELLTKKPIEKNIIEVKERYLNINDSINQFISNFTASDNDVFKIISPMGTGKSNIIESVIENAHSVDLKVLIITNRISVAVDFSKRYSIKMYGEKINNESLVVQFDSLYKYDTQDFDIVIMDEFMSLLLHHRSNLSDFQNINIAKFFTLLHTKKILIADAFLFGFEIELLKGRNFWTIENLYRDNISMNKYSTKENFLDGLLNISKDNKISASFSSLKMLNLVKKKIEQQGKKVITLTSETPTNLKELIYDRFSDFNNDSWDAILYSPTLTVGVSNNNNIIHHFHFDEGNSMDVISSLQMVKRSRNVKVIHIYLGTKQSFKEIDLEVLNNVSVDTLGKFSDRDKSLLFDYDYQTGEMKISEVGKYYNKIESLSNTLENSHSKSFEILLNYQFNTGINSIDLKTSTNIKDELKLIKTETQRKLVKLISENEFEFTQEEYLEIASKRNKLLPKEKLIKLFGDLTKEIDIPNGLEKSFLLDYAYNKNIINNLKYLNYILLDPEKLKRKFYHQLSLKRCSEEEIFVYNFIIENPEPIKEYYSLKELKNDNLKKFLKLIGYRNNNGRFSWNRSLEKYLRSFN